MIYCGHEYTVWRLHRCHPTQQYFPPTRTALHWLLVLSFRMFSWMENKHKTIFCCFPISFYKDSILYYFFYFSTFPGLYVTTERKYNTGADSFFSQLVIRVCPPWWARPLQWVHPVLSLLPLVLQTSLQGIKSCKYNVACVKNLSLIDSQKSNCWAKRVYCLNFNWYLQSPSVRFYELALPPAMPETACLLTASPTDGVCASVKTLTAWKKKKKPEPQRTF